MKKSLALLLLVSLIGVFAGGCSGGSDTGGAEQPKEAVDQSKSPEMAGG